jgi:small subunit ribosomal protein S9
MTTTTKTPVTKKVSKYNFGTGRRKTAVARVRIHTDVKISTLNAKEYKFEKEISPFEVVGKKNSFGISVIASGGGKNGQIEAIQHGIARALVQFDPELRLSLKKAGYLRRDPREVERKKPGLKKARKSPQWSKR